MGSIYVMRHGKSDWSSPGASDHERPLKKRGRDAARRVGRFLTRIGEAPQLVIVSSAVRARTTGEIAYEAGGWEAELRVVPELYEASTGAVAEIIRNVSDEVERILTVGHQPTCSIFVSELIGGGAPAFPTATIARVDLHLGSWGSLRPNSGELKWLINPRLLEAAE